MPRRHSDSTRSGWRSGVVQAERAAPRAAEHVPASRCRVARGCVRSRRRGRRWCCPRVRRAACCGPRRAGREHDAKMPAGRRSAGRSSSIRRRGRRARRAPARPAGCRTARSRACGAPRRRGARCGTVRSPDTGRAGSCAEGYAPPRSAAGAHPRAISTRSRRRPPTCRCATRSRCSRRSTSTRAAAIRASSR